MRAMLILLPMTGILSMVACSSTTQVPPPSSGPSVSPTTPRWTPTVAVTQHSGDTPTAPASPLIVESCVGALEGLPADADGAIAVRRTEEGLVMLDVQTGVVTASLVGPGELLNLSGFFPLVSPDHRHLAIVEGSPSRKEEPHSLRVVDWQGEDVAVPTWLPNWDIVTGWLDESRIEIAVDVEPAGTMAAYNPFTQTLTDLTPTFPDILTTLPPDPDWYLHTAVALYDPTLSRVAYVGFPERLFHLWDAEAKRQLWVSEYLEWAYDPPAWSPDGSQVAFVVTLLENSPASAQLVLVSRDGGILNTVDFGPAGTKSGILYLPQRLGWSPDGDKIAFWLPRSDGQPWLSLSVFDLSTRSVTDYCIEGGGQVPVWSPDGRFVAVYGTIVDTVEAKAYLLDGMSPVGWLARAE